jgi:hypothetical protein
MLDIILTLDIILNATVYYLLVALSRINILLNVLFYLLDQVSYYFRCFPNYKVGAINNMNTSTCAAE